MIYDLAIDQHVNKWFQGIKLFFFKCIYRVSPIGILSLIAGSLAEVEDILKTFRDVGLFVAVNFVGCFIQAFILYPSLYYIIVRKNPFTFLSGIVPALITAFGTSSRYIIALIWATVHFPQVDVLYVSITGNFLPQFSPAL